MKKILALALAAAMSLSLVACSSSTTTETATSTTTTSTTTSTATTETAEPAAEPLTLIYSSVIAPTDPFAIGEAYFCELVGEISGGQLIVEYYENGSLYNQDENPTAFFSGKVDFANSSMEDFDNAPYYSMFKSAYIFDDIDHALNVYYSDLGDEMFDDIAEKVGIRYLGAAFNSTRELCLTEKVDASTINGPEDMSKVLLRMPSGTDWSALAMAVGATPVPIALGETYMALKTGTAMGQDNGLAVTAANSFDEVTSSVIMTDHLVYCMHIAINEARWQSLTAEQQGWIQEAADQAHEYITEIALEAEEAMVDVFADQGIEIVYPEDKQAWIDYASAYYTSEDSYAKELTATWDWDLYAQVRDMA